MIEKALYSIEYWKKLTIIKKKRESERKREREKKKTTNWNIFFNFIDSLFLHSSCGDYAVTCISLWIFLSKKCADRKRKGKCEVFHAHILSREFKQLWFTEFVINCLLSSFAACIDRCWIGTELRSNHRRVKH